MVIRLINIFLLAALLAIPIYGSRKPLLRPKPNAKTDAEHKLDLRKLRKDLDQEEYLMSGHGAPRMDYAACVSSIPNFSKLLEAKELFLTENLTCVPMPENPKLYVPQFRVVSRKKLTQRIVYGSQFNALSLCELQAYRLAQRSNDGEITLDASCQPVAIKSKLEEPEESSETFETYQPVTIILDESKEQSPTKQYTATDALAEPTPKDTQRGIAESN